MGHTYCSWDLFTKVCNKSRIAYPRLSKSHEPRDEQRDRYRDVLAHGRVAYLQHVKLPEPLQNPHLSLIGCHDTSGEGAVHCACVLGTHGLSREEHVVHGDAQLLVQVTGFVRPHRTCRSQVCSRPSPSATPGSLSAVTKFWPAQAVRGEMLYIKDSFTTRSSRYCVDKLTGSAALGRIFFSWEKANWAAASSDVF